MRVELVGPAVNKVGTLPLLAGFEEVKAKYLPPVARDEAMFCYGLSECEAGSDSASMKTRARDLTVMTGCCTAETWISHAGEAEYYPRSRGTDPIGRRGRT